MKELLALRCKVMDLYKKTIRDPSLEFKFFYTHPQRFLQQADVLLLGINPGGRDGNEPPEQREETLLLNGYPDPWSAYFDEIWRPGGRAYPAGQAPLQQRIRKLFILLAGREQGGETLLRNTPASNLIPVRTNDIRHFYFPALKHRFCDDGHQWLDMLVARIQPKMILTFGMAGEIMSLLGYTDPTPIAAWNGQARIALWGDSVILSLPHLSRGCNDNAIEEFFVRLHSCHTHPKTALATLRQSLATIRKKWTIV